MNRTFLITIMSVVMLVAVYLASNVLLPARAHKDDLTDNNHLSDDGEDGSFYNLQMDLSSKTVVVDSGHGGIDPGKTNQAGLLEKDINLSIAVKLEKMLKDKRVNVIMTRNSDEGLYEETDKNKKMSDLKKRCAIIDEADLAVSIHQNSFTSSNVSGAQVFYCKGSCEGKNLAEYIQNSLKEEVDSNNSRVAKSDNSYYILLNTKTPVVIAECGFLSNPTEAAKLSDEEYQNKIAQALCDGIIEYLINEESK